MADLHQNLADLNKYFENIRQLDQLSQKSPVKSSAMALNKDAKPVEGLSKDKEVAKAAGAATAGLSTPWAHSW